MSTITIKEWVNEAVRLCPSNDLPRLDAEVWASSVLNKSRSWIIGHPEFPISSTQLNNLNKGWKKILAGFPLPYLLGEWEFYGYKFIVDQNVMIPRPETELMVDYAIHWLKNNIDTKWFCDVGTGSGCIAISILNQIQEVKAIATDRYCRTLHVAQQNISRFHLETRAYLVQADLIAGITGQCSLFCANLPYVPSSRLSQLPVAKYEPNYALDGGEHGLRYINNLLLLLANWVRRGALILLEIDPDQEALVRRYACSLFNQPGIKTTRDLNGLQRLMAISIN